MSLFVRFVPHMVASMPGCLFDQSWQPLHNTGAVTLDPSEVAMKKEFVYNILSLCSFENVVVGKPGKDFQRKRCAV